MKINITVSRLDPTRIASSVISPKYGASCVFVGTVRSIHAGRRVKAVSYDAFVPLAERVLTAIVRNAEKSYRAKISVSHRTGRLKVGEASVVIAAASMHRAEAFAATRFIIEQIKLRLPVWKKEHYVKGDGRWLSGCALGGHR